MFHCQFCPVGDGQQTAQNRIQMQEVIEVDNPLVHVTPGLAVVGLLTRCHARR
jgi:hypothetical protein